jgi:uncharacterized protein (TIGR02246 family)
MERGGKAMPLTAEDRLAILDLIGRYNQAFDYRNPDAWAATFTPDGVFGNSEGFSVQGTEALRAFAQEAAAREARGRHWNTSHVIEGNGDTATHSCYLMVIALGEAPTIFGVGRYDDQLRKVDGQWRFAQRTLTKECEAHL